MNHDANGLEQMLLMNSRDTEENASLKKLSTGIQTTLLIRLMKQHEL